MSDKAITWAFAQDIQPSTRKFVLIALADSADDFGICWPSYNTIAEKCGIGRKTAIRNVKSLVEDGILTKHSRYKKSGQNSNAFALNMGVEVRDDHPLKDLVSERHPPSVRVTPPQCQSDTQTVIEPSENQRERSASARDLFLRDIDRGYQVGSFEDEFAHLTETEIRTHAEECFERWSDNLSGRDAIIMLKSWMRKGLSLGTVRKPEKAKPATNALQGVKDDDFENPLQPWHQRIRPQVGDGAYFSYIRKLHHDGNGLLQAPNAFIADYVRKNFHQEINAVLKGVEIAHTQQKTKEVEHA